MWEEITERGYRGGHGPVHDYLCPLWTTSRSPAVRPPFANGLERDLDAVVAGLSTSWSSGVVEGHVNRIKMLKRQMFGRAGVPSYGDMYSCVTGNVQLRPVLSTRSSR
uniref:hypothetical protein n=1 Tax=Streptomyces umbrinus TaxID=67370 RepID=UPI0035946B39